jgi:hypothetical protein|tara:strand:- start:237 stop:464 length:228 start_codon:yes stop_codon:yes gene_type:complete
MSYTISDIQKILDFKSWSKRRKIDTLLEIDMYLYSDIGTDSSKTEVDTAKKSSRKIYRAIKSIDNEMGGRLLMHN